MNDSQERVREALEIAAARLGYPLEEYMKRCRKIETEYAARLRSMMPEEKR